MNGEDVYDVARRETKDERIRRIVHDGTWEPTPTGYRKRSDVEPSPDDEDTDAYGQIADVPELDAAWGRD